MPSGQGARDVRVGHRVEAELNEVGSAHLVATRAKLAHRRSGHCHAQARPIGHKKSPFTLEG
jgi:hypothetical protein